MDYITLEVSLETLKKMEAFYQESLVFNVGEYILWKVKTIDEVTITAYSSKKGLKVVFFGIKALDEALIWDMNAKVNEKKIKSAGVSGVVRPGKTSVQVVVGTKVQFVADEFKKLCK